MFLIEVSLLCLRHAVYLVTNSALLALHHGSDHRLVDLLNYFRLVAQAARFRFPSHKLEANHIVEKSTRLATRHLAALAPKFVTKLADRDGSVFYGHNRLRQLAFVDNFATNFWLTRAGNEKDQAKGSLHFTALGNPT